MRTAKRVFAVVCLLAFSLVLFVVPASAEDTTFPNQPLPKIGAITVNNRDQAMIVFRSFGRDCYASADADDDVLLFLVPSGSNYTIYACSNSHTDTNQVYCYFYGPSAPSGTILIATLDNTTGLHYHNCGTMALASINLPIFTSFEAGMAAAAAFLGAAAQVDEQTYRFTVPAGWVAYVQLEDPTQDVEISATMFNNSALIGTNGSYWPSNATIRDGASYPTSGMQFPISGAQTIRWFKDAGGATNLLGQTKSARSTFHPTSNLIEIYNPYHTGSTVYDSTEAATSWLAGDPNPNLVVTVTGLSPDGIRMYPLSDRLDVSSDAASFITSGSNDDYSGYVESSNQPPAPEDADPDNPQPVISWKTPGGDPTPAPTPGGENEPIQSASIADILTNFLNRFTSLFTEGFEAIRNLSENASQFVSRLSSLYAWLPPQILGVLTSAIILAIIVGVLKVFL